MAAPRKVATKRVAGTRVELVRRADLQQPPEVHDPDAVGHREGFLLVVRDQHRRDAELALHLADGAAQLLADLRIERPEGLIEQQHLRLVRQRPRDRHPLLLSAGELRRQPLVESLERHQPQQLLAPLAAGTRAHAAHAQRKLDVLRDGHVAEQGVVLEHQAHAALARGDVRDVAAVQGDAPVIDAGEPGNRAQQRALAAAARSEQHEELPVADVERDVVDDRRAAVVLGDLVEEDGHGADATGARDAERQVRRGSRGDKAVTAPPARLNQQQHALAALQFAHQRLDLRATLGPQAGRKWRGSCLARSGAR